MMKRRSPDRVGRGNGAEDLVEISNKQDSPHHPVLQGQLGSLRGLFLSRFDESNP
jgi:hypothetical protein